jgi:hypothetical protein
MKFPSVKTLRMVFGDKAPLARRILTDRYPLNVTDLPRTMGMYRAGYLKGAELRMEALNELGEFAGVEVLRGEFRNGYYGDVEAEYLNAGDPYLLTVVHDTRRGLWQVMDLATWIERAERRRVKIY